MKGSHVVSRLALACAVVLVSGLGGLAGLPAGLAQAPQPEDEVARRTAPTTFSSNSMMHSTATTCWARSRPATCR
jgi:hypothetical protein